MKKLRKKSIILVFSLFMWLILPAHGQETQTITAKGEGWYEGADHLVGKDKAVKDALVKALEQAVGTMVSSETRVQNFQLLNDNIYTRTEGYIKNWRILNENRAKNVYEVTIEATVAIGDLRKDLRAIGILLGQVGKPRIMMLVAEQNIGRHYYHYWWGYHRVEQTDLTVTENTIMEKFRERGFDLVDHQAQSKNISVAPAYRVADLTDQAAITLGKQADAEVVIVGKALAKSIGAIAGSPMKSVQANISLRAIQIDDGRVLSSGTEHAAAVHVDETTAGVEALKQASAKISDKMMDDIIRNFQKRVGATTVVQLTVFGLTRPQDLQKFKNLLKGQVRGVEGIYERSYEKGVAKIDLDVKGNAQSLADELARKKFKDFNVQVTKSTWNTIELQVMPK